MVLRVAFDVRVVESHGVVMVVPMLMALVGKVGAVVVMVMGMNRSEVALPEQNNAERRDRQAGDDGKPRVQALRHCLAVPWLQGM